MLEIRCSCLHVRNASLRHGERASKIGVDVRFPLIDGREVLHSLAIPPLWTCDTAVVDQDINTIIKELGRLFDFGTNVVDIAKVADRRTKPAVGVVLFEMNLGSMLELVFIDVEDVGVVASFEHHPSQCSTNPSGPARDYDVFVYRWCLGCHSENLKVWGWCDMVWRRVRGVNFA